MILFGGSLSLRPAGVRRAAIAFLLWGLPACGMAQGPLDACLGALADDARFAAIAGKVALGVQAEATPAMLADLTTANPKQVRALADWTAARSECVRAEAASGNPAYRPPLQTYRLEAESALIEAAADLHDRGITFGTFNRRRQAIAMVLRDKVAALSQRIQAQRSAQELADQQARERREQQRALEDAERQAALAQQQAARAREEAELARRAERAARKPPAAQPDRMQRPRVAPLAPYADCFRLGERVVCTYR